MHEQEGLMAKGKASGGGHTAQSIELHIAMAIGQGAGTMLATSRALMAVFDSYGDAIKDSVARWGDIHLRTAEYARALGQIAAHVAIANGHCVIEYEDMQSAINVVQHNRVPPLLAMDCPLCPNVRKKESE
jgi:hypothetical protein